MSWACPYDLCDGRGLRYDEATNTAYDCRCRPQRKAQAKARSLSAVIPRRYRDVSFERPGLSGNMHVGKQTVRLDVQLSFLLTPLKGPIEAARRTASTSAASRSAAKRVRLARLCAGRLGLLLPTHCDRPPLRHAG